jgi:hypothetical protein
MAENPFIGAWRLVSMESQTSDGRVRLPYGSNARGYITYTAEGYMCVAIMDATRPRFAAANDFVDGTPEEQIAAGKRYISYAGSYTIRDEHVIVHHVEVSLFPNWIGADQERFYEFNGNRLTLRTPPVLIQGKQRTSHLTWERVEHA